jgi:hypothetical protein
MEPARKWDTKETSRFHEREYDTRSLEKYVQNQDLHIVDADDPLDRLQCPTDYPVIRRAQPETGREYTSGYFGSSE